MAKIKTNAKAVTLKLENKLYAITGSRSLLDEIGRLSVERIQFQARIGRPMRGSENGRFPKLSEAWVKRKERLKTANETHPTYGRGRKNVTFTGQLVSAVVFKIKSGFSGRSAAAVNVFVDNTSRKPYLGVKGGPVDGEKKTNSEVYKNLLNLNPDYNFLGINEQNQKRIKQITLRFLRKALRSG